MSICGSQSVAKIAAVIFDYYETLAELSNESRVRAFDAFAMQCGVALPSGEAYEHWRLFTTADAKARFGDLPRHPLDGEPLPFVSFGEVWLKRFQELFDKWGVDTTPEAGARMYREAHIAAPLYSDALPALENLRERSKLAILSDADADFLHGNLARNSLVMDAVVSSEELRAYKPHVSMFREVCARLDVEPAQAVYVGDSAWADIAGARNAGMHAVWINRYAVDWPDDIEPPNARVLSLSELPETVAQL